MASNKVIERLLAISAAFLLGGVGVGAAQAQTPSFESNAAPNVQQPICPSGGGQKSYNSLWESLVKFDFLGWMDAQTDDPEVLYLSAVEHYNKGLRQEGEHLAIRAQQCGHTGALLLLLEQSITAKRDEEARRYLERGIDLGLPAAKFILAEQYDKGGMRLPKDPKRAFYWYHESAKHGDPRAMAAIAYYFFRGTHGTQSEVAAAHWYHEAAKAGHVESMTAYGWMLANGRGLQMDKAEARHYFNKANSAGSKAAIQFIAELDAHSKPKASWRVAGRN